ncbi:MAG: chemotaxis protein CheR, partial [Selenomonadaceae bacterium]|nr:chemotaxis protein CheR [Selenomonadaceae bacterium]
MMDDKDWEIFKQQLNRKTGIDLQLYKEQQMRRRINNLIQKTPFKSYTSFFADAVRDKQKFADFIEYLTINVSEFFRNPDKFDQVEKDVIPYLLKRNDSLNIWSAGCSIGAEPYTLSIIMKELTPSKRHRILATDLDIEIIGKAKKGIYTADEIRAMRSDRKVK